MDVVWKVPEESGGSAEDASDRSTREALGHASSSHVAGLGGLLKSRDATFPLGHLRRVSGGVGVGAQASRASRDWDRARDGIRVGLSQLPHVCDRECWWPLLGFMIIVVEKLTIREEIWRHLARLLRCRSGELDRDGLVLPRPACGQLQLVTALLLAEILS